jgi:hypothetical protein
MESSVLLTSMSAVAGSGSNWLGELADAFLPPKQSGNSGDCLGLGALGITGVDCDMVSNFVCQAPDPPGYEPFPSIRLPNATRAHSKKMY